MKKNCNFEKCGALEFGASDMFLQQVLKLHLRIFRVIQLPEFYADSLDFFPRR